MNKHKHFISFVLCVILILSISIVAYAIGARALKAALFYEHAWYISEPSLAQFNTDDIFWISTQVTGSDGELWWYGVPDSNSNPYSFVGARHGYSRVYDLDGLDMFTFNLFS